MRIYQIKINGIIEIDKEIKKDEEYSAKLTCIGNKDGKVSKIIDGMDREVLTFTMENKGSVLLIDERQAEIKGKAKKMTNSQIWRFVVEKTDDYSMFMNKMIANQDKVIDFVKNL